MSAAWVTGSTTSHVDTGGTPEQYGYQWWVTTAHGHRAFAAMGYGGIGHRIRAETGLAVDPDLTSSKGHGIPREAQHRLLHDIPRLADATVHVSPSKFDGRTAHDSVAHHGIHARAGG